MGFCVYCGKELEEGATCDCEGAKKAAEQKIDFSENLTNVAAAGTEAVGKTKVALLKIVKAPVTEGAAYMDGTNTITSVAMIVCQAILSGLFASVLALKYNSIIKDMGGGWFDLSSLKVSGIKAFFMTVLFSLIVSIFFAAIFFLVGKIIKIETNPYIALDLAGIRSSFLFASNILAVVLSIFVPSVGAVVFYGCGLFVAIIIGCILSKKYEGRDDQIAYATLIGMLVFFIVISFLMSKVCTVYLPKDFMSNLGGASSLLSFL